jgi:chemotaxis protein MotB
MANNARGGHSGGAARRRGGHEEEHGEHENEERWLLTYADMITLLMVLFIVMFAISQVDQKKFLALSAGLTAGFGAPVSMLHGSNGMLDVGGEIAPDSVNLAGQAGGKGAAQDQDTINPAAVSELATATEQAAVAKEVAKLKEAQEALKKALAQAGEKDGATFRFDERGLVVSIATDKVLFDNGSAQLKPQGRRILQALGPTLKAMPNQLSVDGHTNRLPIHTAQFPSNWELSTARATGVLRYLHDNDGVPVTRMSAAGFADTRPVLPASDPKSLVVNRRVEIVVIAAVDDSAGRAVESLGNAESGNAESGNATAEGGTEQ